MHTLIHIVKHEFNKDIFRKANHKKSQFARNASQLCVMIT